MTTAQKLAIRQNEIRIRSAALGGIETQTDETRGEIKSLREEYVDIETRQAALTLSEDKPIDTRHAEGNEGNELRGIIDRANVGSIFSAAVEHRQTDGAEKEIQEHYGLGPNPNPPRASRKACGDTGPWRNGNGSIPDHPGSFSRQRGGLPTL